MKNVKTIEQGLNKEQVEERIKLGQTNKTKKKVEKSVIRILLENTFTPFNIALFSIGLIFIFFIIYLNSVGQNEMVEKEFGISKFGFLLPAVVNSLIGSIQEIHGKRVLSKLRLLNQSKAIVIRDGEKTSLVAEDIVLDDIVILSAGDQCLADSIVKEGEIRVDESMLTGESDPVIKKEGDVVYAGSSIIVGSSIVQVQKVGDDTYASNLSSKVKELPRHKSELMVSINKIIYYLVYAIFVVVTIIIVTLCVKIHIHNGDAEVFGSINDLALNDASTWGKIFLTLGAFSIGMIPEGLVLLTSVALAVSIIKLAKQKTLIQELYSLENLSRVDTICLDKTGTLTDGTMEVVDAKFIADEQESIAILKDILGAFDESNPTSTALKNKYGFAKTDDIQEKIHFSSALKHSGIVYQDGRKALIGAPEYLLKKGSEYLLYVEEKAKEGKRVIALVVDDKAYALFVIEDRIRSSAKETIHFFHENNVTAKIISGDNLLTVTKIASNCGVIGAEKGISLENVSNEELSNLVEEYTIFARVSPEQKQIIVESLQKNGHKVAMTGDGVNDILALRKANASITFAKATDAAKSCSDVVLLDNDFIHLKEVVSQGRRVVNNVERSAILFLMKTIAVIGMSIALIPFARAQFWYSVENVYLMQTAVIGVGGFLFSLEPQKEPIKGSFQDNVFPKAFISGLLVLLSMIIPLILSRAPVAFGGQSIISGDNAKTLISIMSFLAAFVCAISMSIPFTRYRLVCIFSIIAVGLILIFALPTSYLGGRATSISMFIAEDGNFFHSEVFKTFFQPWNSAIVKDLFSDYRNFVVMAVFLVVSFPLYLFASRLIRKGKPFSEIIKSIKKHRN